MIQFTNELKTMVTKMIQKERREGISNESPNSFKPEIVGTLLVSVVVVTVYILVFSFLIREKA